MSRLLQKDPYADRDPAAFLGEMTALTRHHLEGCPEFARIWPDWTGAGEVEELPYLHVGLFKRILFRTESAGLRHRRTLTSSATTSGTPSRIVLDDLSSELQSRSSLAILGDVLGDEARPLLILDHSGSLRRRGEVSARIAAAMSLRPMASDLRFLLREPDEPGSLDWEVLRELLSAHRSLIVYGFTWMLWLGWGQAEIPGDVADLLSDTRIDFVHSGGWKRLEGLDVPRQRFEAALLRCAHPGSRVTDFYGLVEQVGVVYPLCEAGLRHVPVWADVLVRDPYTLSVLDDEPGLLQLLNPLAWGAPYHSVLTEDLGRLRPGGCPCGRGGKRFELLGRVPMAELRGCANV